MNFQRSTAFEVATTPNAQCWLVENVCVFGVASIVISMFFAADVLVATKWVARNEMVERERHTHTFKQQHIETDRLTDYETFAVAVAAAASCSAYNTNNESGDDANEPYCVLVESILYTIHRRLRRLRFDVFGGKKICNELRKPNQYGDTITCKTAWFISYGCRCMFFCSLHLSFRPPLLSLPV